jgi:hypothetical protein
MQPPLANIVVPASDPGRFRVEQGNNRLFCRSSSWIGYRNSRKIEGEIANITVVRDGSKWYVSIQAEREVERPFYPSGSIVGIDPGSGSLCHALQRGSNPAAQQPEEEASTSEALSAHDGAPGEGKPELA